MIEEPPLLRYRRDWARPSEAQIAGFRGVPTGFVADALGGGGAMAGGLRPLAGLPSHVAGPALTAGNPPGGVLATLAALAFARAGDVLVASVGAHTRCAAAGDRIMGMLANSGGTGLVTDGPMRDVAGIREIGLPVWCAGLNPASPFSTGPAEVGMRIDIGGVSVGPGDMVVADEDGVVIVPFARLDAVLARLEKVRALEVALDAEVAGGRCAPQSIEDMIADGRAVAVESDEA